MRTLIVGIGALGGIIGGRLLAAGAPVALATRDAESARRLRASGLRVSGVGGDAAAAADQVAALGDLRDTFDLIVLATKAKEAIDAAPRLAELLAAGGTLLPIQNGGVSQILGERLGEDRVLGGLSNLGGTMTALGAYEQKNAGYILIGELAGGASERATRVQAWLGRGVDVKVTPNLRGAIWSKLLLNCSVTTLGAIAGCPMRGYIDSTDGRTLFDRSYDEALAVALATQARPEKMIVEPIPPRDGPDAYEAWLAAVLAGYGDITPSMLQDFERGRTTEIDFINGYVADVGRKHGVATPVNAAIVETVHAIERGERRPAPARLREILTSAGG